ncbi:UNVERIFIED_ORG: NarL family two-component system response regulator LiaR [Microbispora rosea subsp. rosea]
MIRVLIVDDHQVVRQGLRYVLEDEADIEVVGERADGHGALEAIDSLRPNVVLLDMVMPGMGGLEVLERIRERPAPPAVIVLTSFVENEVALQAVRGGALSYLSKTSAVDRVVEAVRMAVAGGSVLDPPVAAMLVQRVRDDDGPAKEDPLRMLAPRERDVLAALARGQSNREIARTLSLSETTVKSYVSSILTKLRLQDRTQAAIFGLQCGLVPLGEALSADQLPVED